MLDSLDPGQQVVKIVNEELTALMGGTGARAGDASSGPTVILMAGLQGSGKTTACAKLAQLFEKEGKDVALAACDVYRPAAVEQLVTWASAPAPTSTSRAPTPTRSRSPPGRSSRPRTSAATC